MCHGLLMINEATCISHYIANSVPIDFMYVSTTLISIIFGESVCLSETSPSIRVLKSLLSHLLEVSPKPFSFCLLNLCVVLFSFILKTIPSNFYNFLKKNTMPFWFCWFLQLFLLFLLPFIVINSQSYLYLLSLFSLFQSSTKLIALCLWSLSLQSHSCQGHPSLPH